MEQHLSPVLRPRTPGQVWQAARSVFQRLPAQPAPAALRREVHATLGWAVHVEALRVFPSLDDRDWAVVDGHLQTMGTMLMAALELPAQMHGLEVAHRALGGQEDQHGRSFEDAIVLVQFGLLYEWELANLTGLTHDRGGVPYRAPFEYFLEGVRSDLQRVGAHALLVDIKQFDHLFQQLTGRVPPYKYVDPATQFALVQQQTAEQAAAQLAAQQERAERTKAALKVGGAFVASSLLSAALSRPERRAARRAQAAADRRHGEQDELRGIWLDEARRRNNRW